MDTKKRILLVDDEQINLEFFDVMLTKLGFVIEKAENGAEALEVVKRWKPDLIILDNVMPKLSGWEVTRILKSSEEYRDYAEIPIIMFSAMDDVKDKVEGLELGADDYITKPFNFSEVLARIRVVLRTRELVGQIERREERIRVSEEIADRVLEFIDGLREPLRALTVEAAALAPECGSAKPFVDRASRDASEALEGLDALDKAVSSLKAEAESLKMSETALPTLKKNLRA
jgi:DNA-binding response OmpR family regulator